jgi:hypothetical protein
VGKHEVVEEGFRGVIDVGLVDGDESETELFRLAEPLRKKSLSRPIASSASICGKV